MITMSAPAFDPQQRDPARVTPADGYRRSDPVWVFRNGQWHVGVVDSASPWAVMVTYQRTGTRGTVVDTVPAEYLVRRTGPGGGDM